MTPLSLQTSKEREGERSGLYIPVICIWMYFMDDQWVHTCIYTYIEIALEIVNKEEKYQEHQDNGHSLTWKETLEVSEYVTISQFSHHSPALPQPT